MYGIHQEVYDRLLAYFRKQHHINQVILFGSRAKGLYTSRSDIHLCIEMNEGPQGSVVLDIEELVGVYSCDIVFHHQMSGEIKNQIQKSGIVIYTK